MWIIATFPALKIDIENYPAVKAHLKQFIPKLKQSGETFIDEIVKSKKPVKKQVINGLKHKIVLVIGTNFCDKKLFTEKLAKT